MHFLETTDNRSSVVGNVQSRIDLNSYQSARLDDEKSQNDVHEPQFLQLNNVISSIHRTVILFFSPFQKELFFPK